MASAATTAIPANARIGMEGAAVGTFAFYRASLAPRRRVWRPAAGLERDLQNSVFLQVGESRADARLRQSQQNKAGRISVGRRPDGERLFLQVPLESCPTTPTKLSWALAHGVCSGATTD